jgi:hypothetical protein
MFCTEGSANGISGVTNAVPLDQFPHPRRAHVIVFIDALQSLGRTCLPLVSAKRSFFRIRHKHNVFIVLSQQRNLRPPVVVVRSSRTSGWRTTRCAANIPTRGKCFNCYYAEDQSHGNGRDRPRASPSYLLGRPGKVRERTARNSSGLKPKGPGVLL